MGHKTKKAKILAAQHRQQLLETLPGTKLPAGISGVRPLDSRDLDPRPTYQFASATTSQVEKTSVASDYTYIQKDLRKIAVLSVLAIGMEIGLKVFLKL